MMTKKDRLENVLSGYITKFAGSMTFVYLHAIVFIAWMLFIESDPWQTLTLVVSLEAIFLSTFIMIGQNRQQQLDRDVMQKAEDASEEDLVIDKEALRLLKEIADTLELKNGS
jgi:uncharacterized membrane protein